MPRVLDTLLFLLLKSCLTQGIWVRKQTNVTDRESQLLIDLFKEYQPFTRPVKNMSQAVEVEMSLQLILLVNIDEVGQQMHTNVWMTFQWMDEYLSWRKELYNNIDVLRVPSDKVWMPDIVLKNIGADGQYDVTFKSNVLINSTGKILWVPPAIYRSTCIMHVEHFPFDEQTCWMNFTSWTYNSSEIRIKSIYDGVDLSQFRASYIWDIMDAPVMLADDGNGAFYHVLLRRKTLFYTVILIMPCVLMALLTGMVFYLPTAAGEKIGMSILLLLSVVVFLNVLQKILPSTSLTVPLMAKYVLFILVMNVVSIFASVYIVNICFRNSHTHTLSPWVKLLFTKLIAKLLLMKRPRRTPVMVSFDLSTSHDIDERKLSTYAALKEALQQIKVDEDRNQPELHAPERRQVAIFSSPVNHHPNCRKFEAAQQSREPQSPTLANGVRSAVTITEPEKDGELHVPGMPEVGYAVLRTVEMISEHLKKQEDARKVSDDWTYVSMVIDRILLYIFAGCIIGVTLVLLLSTPNVFDAHVNQKKVLARLSQDYGWTMNLNYMNTLNEYSDRFE